MFRHLSQEFELPLKNGVKLKQERVIEGKADGQAIGLPNFKQPTLVWKKKIKKDGYGITHPNIITSHMSENVVNQRHDWMIR